MLCEGTSYQGILGTSTGVTVELTQPALCVKDRQELVRTGGCEHGAVVCRRGLGGLTLERARGSWKATSLGGSREWPGMAKGQPARPRSQLPREFSTASDSVKDGGRDVSCLAG